MVHNGIIDNVIQISIIRLNGEKIIYQLKFKI